MRENNYILDIINNIDEYPEFKRFYFELTEDQKFSLLTMINSLDLNRLYKSPIHGQFHSEKVLLFTYILAIKYQYTINDLRIITDAAMYHDMGRESDNDNSLHGFASGYLFESVYGMDPFYQNKANLHLIQAIMDAHSYRNGRTDNSLDIVYFNHDLEELGIPFEKFKAMAHLLMDADALDRKRFKDNSPAGLKEKYLYYPETLDMVKLATEINEAYRKFSQEEKISLEELYSSTGCVVHSIGFVFPRVVSVLTHGILSAYEREKNNIDMHRNFEGGNSTHWISVVPEESVHLDTPSSIDAFIKNGIVTVANRVTYYETPYTVSDASIAQMKNLPYNKGGHDEERYVLDRIEPEQINELYIARECADKDLSQLSYIFPNIDISAYEKMIKKFLTRYQATTEDIQIVAEHLEDYKIKLDEYLNMNKQDRCEQYNNVATELRLLNSKINADLAIIIKKYYTKLFKLDPAKVITPVMVLEDELIQAGIEYHKVLARDKISFFVELSKERIPNMGTK